MMRRLHGGFACGRCGHQVAIRETSQSFHPDELKLVDSSVMIEHVGGPDDGQLLPLNGNARRAGGHYVPVSWKGRTLEMRFVRE